VAKSKKFFNKAPYNSYTQVLEMQKLCPWFTHKVNRVYPDYITFTGELQPEPTFPVYTVRVVYRGWKNPRVQVLSPELVKVPPHYYGNTRSLCLYKPSHLNWKENMSIAQEIIPRVAAWIFFYEMWLSTGIWYGDEAEHDDIKDLGK
jgi:hypothetical protein